MKTESKDRIVLVFLLSLSLFFIPIVPARADSSFPYVDTISSGNSGGSVTSHVVNYSSGIMSGDMVLVCIGLYGSPGTVTWPGQWTVIFSTPAAASAMLNQCYIRIANSTLTGSFTITSTSSVSSAWFMYRITGFRSDTTPYGNSVTATSQFPNPPAGAASPTENTLYITEYAWTGTASNTAYPPSYSSNQATNRWSNAAGIGIATATRNIRTDFEDPSSGTLSASTVTVSGTIVIRPAQEAVTDYTPLLITIGIFVLLMVIGLRLPFVHILAGLLGFFLGYQLYSDLSDLPLASVILALSVLLFFSGILRGE